MFQEYAVMCIDTTTCLLLLRNKQRVISTEI